eukprot:XP_011440101.1 PREDICTED: BPTI/Kunitz domain-containing protein 5-like [Crassostrea gigas]
MHCQIISLHYYKDTFFMSHWDRFGMDCVHFLIHLCCFTAVLRVCYGRVQIQSPGTLPEGCLDIKPESDPICGGPGFKRYAFDPKKGRCTSFIHHGCRESKNVFSTRSECQRTCACNVSLNQGKWCGTQDPYKLRYYWERESGLCRPFWYSGCSGNHNRFASIEYCQRVCDVNYRPV